MHLGMLDASELIKVWEWMKEEPALHLHDGSPETFADFVKAVSRDNFALFSVKTGHKLIGAIGFDLERSSIAGMHFIQEVRGSGAPVKAFQGLLLHLHENGFRKVTATFFENNPRVAGFFRKLGAKFEPTNAAVEQNGQPVQLTTAVFDGTVNAV